MKRRTALTMVAVEPSEIGKSSCCSVLNPNVAPQSLAILIMVSSGLRGAIGTGIRPAKQQPSNQRTQE